MAQKTSKTPLGGTESDYVNDPVFGIVPKDAETMLRLRNQAQAANEPDPTIQVPVEIQEKVASKGK